MLACCGTVASGWAAAGASCRRCCCLLGSVSACPAVGWVRSSGVVRVVGSVPAFLLLGSAGGCSAAAALAVARAVASVPASWLCLGLGAEQSSHPARVRCPIHSVCTVLGAPVVQDTVVVDGSPSKNKSCGTKLWFPIPRASHALSSRAIPSLLETQRFSLSLSLSGTRLSNCRDH